MLYLINNLLRGHLRQCLAQRLITTSGKVIVYVLWVNVAAVTQHGALLLTIKGDVTIVGYGFVSNRVAIEKTLYRLSFR